MLVKHERPIANRAWRNNNKKRKLFSVMLKVISLRSGTTVSEVVWLQCVSFGGRKMDLACAVNALSN